MESKPTKSFHKFQGSKRSKYKRSSTSVTQKSISPGGFNPPGEAEVQLVQDPEGSHIKDDHKQSDNDEFLKRDQKNRDDLDERNDEHGINSGDAEDENKTDNGDMLADADYLDDHGDARGDVSHKNHLLKLLLIPVLVEGLVPCFSVNLERCGFILLLKNLTFFFSL